MKKILHVSCSPRGQAAESHRLSQKIIGYLLQKEPTAVLVNRVIGGGAISHVDENYAISQQSSADVSQEGSIARSEELIAEIESSDFVVIGTPMHNFTVPSALKAWIDHVVRVTTAVTARIPSAPGLFSTMTGFSQRRASLSANKRAEISAPVPAGNGVMIRTLRCGQVSAREDVGRTATAVEVTAVKTTRNDAMARMSSLRCLSGRPKLGSAPTAMDSDDHAA